MSLLGRLTGIGSLIALATFTSPRNTEAEVFVSPKLGVQFPSKEVVNNDYSAGFSIGIDFRLANPTLSLDFGLSVYNSPGDSYSSREKEWFRDTTENYSKSFNEISLSTGATTFFRTNSRAAAPYIGGGFTASILSENESYSMSGYREGYYDSDTDVTDLITGPYFKLGLDIPFEKGSLFIEGEFRNLGTDYLGAGALFGYNFPIEQ